MGMVVFRVKGSGYAYASSWLITTPPTTLWHLAASTKAKRNTHELRWALTQCLLASDPHIEIRDGPLLEELGRCLAAIRLMNSEGNCGEWVVTIRCARNTGKSGATASWVWRENRRSNFLPWPVFLDCVRK